MIRGGGGNCLDQIVDHGHPAPISVLHCFSSWMEMPLWSHSCPFRLPGIMNHCWLSLCRKNLQITHFSPISIEIICYLSLSQKWNWKEEGRSQSDGWVGILINFETDIKGTIFSYLIMNQGRSVDNEMVMFCCREGYRDLINAADTINEMKTLSEQVYRLLWTHY